MDIQAKILALLHGDLREGNSLSRLLTSLANSPEQQKILVEHLSLSRRYMQLGADIVPTASADKAVWDRIEMMRLQRNHAASRHERSLLTRIMMSQIHVLWGALILVVGIIIGYFLVGNTGIEVDRGQIVDKDGVIASNHKQMQIMESVSPIEPFSSSVAQILAVDSQSTPQHSDVRSQSAARPVVLHRDSPDDKSQALLLFDGANDFVKIQNVPLDLNTSLMVEATVKLDSTNRTEWIVSYSVTGENGNLLLGVEKGHVRLLTYDVYDISNDLTSDIQLQAGKWYHIVGVQDTVEKVVQIYVDGVLAGEKSLNSLSSGMQNGTLFIGARDWFGTGKIVDFISGSIKDVRLWNRLVGVTELKEEGKSREIKQGIIGFWPLNEVEGNIAKDLSNEHNGNIRGLPSRILLSN